MKNKRISTESTNSKVAQKRERKEIPKEAKEKAQETFKEPQTNKKIPNVTTEENKNLMDTTRTPIEVQSRVYSWGNGDAGQLGLGSEITDQITPSEIKTLRDKKIISVVSGGMHTLALSIDGKVFSWGCNDEGVLGREGPEDIPLEVKFKTKIVKLAAGDSISVALDENNVVYTWGLFRGPGGVLGHSVKRGKIIKQANTPMAVPRIKATDITAGHNHILVLSKTRKVYAWGDCSGGRLGYKISERHKNTSFISLTPRITQINADHIGAGGYHSIACQTFSSKKKSLPKHPKEKNIHYRNTPEYYDKQGNRNIIYDNQGDITLPETNYTNTNPIHISCAGVNNYHQAEEAKDTYWGPYTPIAQIHSIKNIQGGEYSTCILEENGTLWTRGRNDQNQLGTNTNKNIDTFIKYQHKTDTVSITNNHLGCISKGALFTSGANFNSQLGHTSQTTDKVLFPNDEIPISIGTGAQHTTAVTLTHKSLIKDIETLTSIPLTGGIYK
ncbi:regulator of chromosome condensation [Nematocida sp. AWRm80]|nr:regulator of chromosome condensation [Nematocida sp. AWRm80]